MPKVTIEKINELREKKMTYKQIAQELGTSENYIKMTVYRSRNPDYVQSDRQRNKERGKEKRKYTQSQKTIQKNKEAAEARISLPIPNTDMIITNGGGIMQRTVGQIGEDKVGAFIDYHIQLFQMGKGVNKEDVDELYLRFVRYLEYCSEHNIMPGNMAAYMAIGVTSEDIRHWASGKKGTPRHKQFAQDVRAFFNAVHEQAPMEGLLNPILSIFWQKAYAGLSDQPQPESEDTNPLGEQQSAEQIAAKYSEVQLPD